MRIEFREYRERDYGELEKIIRETWHYDEFCSPKTAGKLAGVFLSSCLANQTFSRVALLDGKPVGIILAKDVSVRTRPLRFRLRQMGAIASLCLSKEGRSALKMFKSVADVDGRLLSDAGGSYPAELALFAVDASCRGAGIGGELFDRALGYLRDRHLDAFYLFTDTSCNYGFYEHRGMVRRGERMRSFDIGGRRIEMSFFIYDHTGY